MNDPFPIRGDIPMPPQAKGGRPPAVRKIAAQYAADLAAGKYASKGEAAAAYMAKHKPQIDPENKANESNYRSHVSYFIKLMSQ